jgi:TonB family protein
MLAWLFLASLGLAGPPASVRSDAVSPDALPRGAFQPAVPLQPRPADSEPFPAGFAKGAFRSGGDVVPPVPLKESQPSYPPAAASRGANGVVEVLAVVLPDGTVGAARALTSIDQLPEIDTEAVATARRYIFKAGTRNGVPVPVVVTIFVSFTLPGVPRNAALVQGGTTDPPLSVSDAFARGAEAPGLQVLRPLPVKKVYPTSPSRARSAGQSARVEFLARLDVEGAVSDLQLLKSAGAADDGEAERAVKQWKFEPAIKAGKPVPLLVTIFMDF